jgi:glycosyltransferase involved in cell wall biosynthesis
MKVAVIIPCRNEKNYIEECIDAIFACKLSSDIELKVIVVDGMSNDGTREVIHNLSDKYVFLYLVDNVQQLTPYAFNLGIHYTDAEFYQIVGARQILTPNYLQTAIDTLNQNKDLWCIGGAVDNVYSNSTGEIISKAMSTSFGMGLGNFRVRTNSSYVDTVGTPMYPSWVFEKIGFFDEELIRNQDDDFNFRITKAGGKIWFEHAIQLKYYVRASFKGLFRQFFQYGYWKVYVNRKHRAVTTIRQLVPPVFTLFICLFPIYILMGKTTSLFALVGLGVYTLLACLVGLKKGNTGLERGGIIKTFPILHLSYGFGYLLGMFHFILLGKSPSSNQKRLSR